ncbi:hypothetical protein ERC79_06085 [Rhodococcus sp. ABRD24]|nr:hypothetical protein ERC79_06085 [Rhodococcus sp. ABRD24]
MPSRVAGSRWAIEKCFQATENEVGLDRCQVRGVLGLGPARDLVDAGDSFLAILRRGAHKGDLRLEPKL